MNINTLRADGSIQSIEQVIETYSSMVYGIAMSYSKNPTDSDDILQEVFLVYFKKNMSYADEEHRKAWLIRTTMNCAKKVVHSTWRKKTVPYNEIDVDREKCFEFALKEENGVYNELVSLPEKYRIVLYLYYFEGYPVEEISRLLGIKSGTIRMQLSRGREMMREKLKGEYFNE